MKGFADKMTDHQVLTNTTSTTSPTMGLQAHPCSNKRTIEGLEEPAGRTQPNHNHHYNNNNNNNNNQQVYQVHAGPRAAKQQCTIRVGVEAPDHLTTLVPSNCNSGTESVNNNSWYRDVQQQQQHAPDYETYVNGFTAAEVRASTPYSTSSTYYSSTSTHNTENVAVPAVEYSSYASNGSNNVQYSSQNVYQNLTSMLPVANGSGESLADRFERVCSSPRPYVQYSGREEAAGYHYGASNESRSDERYWTFGYTAACPRKTGPAGYAKCNSSYNGYNGENGFGHHKATGYQQHQQQLVGGGQTIQRDENGKSYLELGAKAAVQPEWTRPQMWPANNNGQQQQQQQHYAVAPPTPLVKSCSKCGHVLSNAARSLPQPCYRHQRLSVLSLSMLKLNRYRQCSDPSLHRSVLICNTLRHIEDEMEREGPTETSSAPTSSSSSSTANSCDTCCCSHCGTVFNKPDSYDNSASSNSNNSVGVYDTTPETNFINAGEYGGSQSSTTTTTTATTTTTIATSSKSNSVVHADEDDSGFGDEDSRDIDWSSVFSMSTASGFDVSPGGNSSSSDSYLCDSNSSDPSLFAGAELVSELGLSNWKTSHCGSATNGHSGGATSWTSDSSDFSGVRWKSELGDELEGFVHILVGS